MPLTQKGTKILANMRQEYGDKKGESVFYASRNKGTISGVEKKQRRLVNDHHGPAATVAARRTT